MNLSGLRRSDVATGNPLLKETLPDAAPQGATANFAWLSSTGYRDGVVLLGGTSIVDFRDARSAVGVAAGLVAELLVHLRLAHRRRGAHDGARRCDQQQQRARGAERFGSSEAGRRTLATAIRMFYPNIAVLQFTDDHAAIRDHVARIGQERNIVDLLAQIVAWLGYCWAVGDRGNPLMQGHGIPSATLLERAHGLADIDLSPGLPSASSCPEAIWQAARWWYEAYDREPSSKSDASFTPRGAYLIRQPAAAALGIRDDVQGDQIVGTTRGDELIEGLRRPRAGKRPLQPRRSSRTRPRAAYTLTVRSAA